MYNYVRQKASYMVYRNIFQAIKANHVQMYKKKPHESKDTFHR